VDYIAEQMDEHTRTIKARIVLDNAERLLKIGMFAHVKLSMQDDESSLIIPEDSLLKDGAETFVFTQVAPNTFFKQIVKTGRTFTNGIEITEGLKKNDSVALQGAFILKSEVLKDKMGAG